jgi:NUAK family SNF1-like kinase
VIEKALGEGTYGKVYLAVDRRTGNHVAIKEYSKRALLEMPELSRFVEREISILSQVKFGHPNIINLLDYISTEEFHFLVMEFCQLGCLESPYNPHQQFSEEIAHRYFVQMVNALYYLHETIHAVHLDLQLSNVCVDINDNIKIVDFGVSNYYSGDTMTNLYGNSLYACPEMLLNKPYHGPDADVWSLGCCLYKMLTGYHPFRNAQKALVRDFMIPLEEEEELSEDVKDLLNNVLCLDIKKRYTLSKIKEHVWFKNGPPLP